MGGFRRDYVVNIVYEKGKVWSEFAEPFYTDSLKFDGLEEAMKFVEGKQAYDYLDECVRLKDDEKVINVVDEKGNVVWEIEEVILRALTEADPEQVEMLDELSGNGVADMFDCEEYAWGVFVGNELVGYCTLGGADDYEMGYDEYPE